MVTLFERSGLHNNGNDTKDMICTPVFMCKKRGYIITHNYDGGSTKLSVKEKENMWPL